MPYFDEPVGRVKIQTMSKNSQRYYTTKRLIKDLLSNTPNFMSVWENFVDIYLRGMRNRSMQSGTELAREIQLTDWSTAGNLSNRSSGIQILRDICTRFGRYLYSTKVQLDNKNGYWGRLADYWAVTCDDLAFHPLSEL